MVCCFLQLLYYKKIFLRVTEIVIVLFELEHEYNTKIDIHFILFMYYSELRVYQRLFLLSFYYYFHFEIFLLYLVTIVTNYS